MAITAEPLTAAASTLTPTFTFASALNAGEVCVIVMGVDSAITGIAWPGSWAELRDDAGTNFRSSIAWLKAAGGETTVAPVGSGVADRWEGVMWRIPAGEWHGTAAPEVGAPTATSTVNPNPPSITPSWGSQTNNIFLAATVRDDSVANTITAYPTNYSTAQLDNNATTSGANSGGAVRIVTASPEDPGTFTISAAETANSYTIAVRPAAAGTVVSPAVVNIVVTGQTPTITVSDNKAVSPALVSIVVTGQTPTITVSDHKVLTPAAGSVLVTGQTPGVFVGVNLAPALASVLVTGQTPTVVATDNKVLTPAAASVLVTGQTPAAHIGVNLAPTPASIAMLTFAPNVVLTDNQTFFPAAASIAVTGQTPTVSVSTPPIEGNVTGTPIGTRRGVPVEVSFG